MTKPTKKPKSFNWGTCAWCGVMIVDKTVSEFRERFFLHTYCDEQRISFMLWWTGLGPLSRLFYSVTGKYKSERSLV